ncbi:MAG: sigma-54-dependent Fis family transcriptional regulator [Zoogloea sp.]|nr:sigma-54-dependent Fis family transcriptional regulator [Zoogloea sp.]
MAKHRILVVDDEDIARRNLAHVLEREGLDVDCAAEGLSALALLEKQKYQLVLTDLRMPGMDGLTLLHRVRESSPDTEVVVITAHASTESAVAAMKDGAFYYIEKPFRLPDVRKVVREALEKVSLRQENAALKVSLEQATGRSRIVTHDPAMKELLSTASRVAPTDCNVLIVGETGTGKELLARHIHEHSNRADGPFVAINCGAMSDDLLANELFGHERGAYTGAANARAGLVEAAGGGTLFLDEVTETSPAMQVKLLRLLQEREYYPLGANQPRKANVRFLAATNRDPAAYVAEGRFRQDLYFRLNVVMLTLPPLRARRGDLPLLAAHFLARAAQRMDKPVSEIHPHAFELLLTHDFPGNIRELENLIERGVALAGGPVITADLLPPEVGAHANAENGPTAASAEPWAIVPLEEMERLHILRTLDHTGGNRAKAAQLLGIDRVSLWRKLRRYFGDEE